MRLLILLFILLSAPSIAKAECTLRTNSEHASASIALPATLSIPRNAASGTQLWDSGWRAFGGDMRYDCNMSNDRAAGYNAAGMGAAVPGHANNGFPSVYETNVPGIGVSVYWCDMNQLSCHPYPGQITPLGGLDLRLDQAPWDFWGTLAQPHWRVLLIKTGDIDASAGAVTIGGPSTVHYGAVHMSSLSLTGSSQITGLGCEIRSDSLNIDVVLPTLFISPTHASPSVARTFSFGVVCDASVKVSYQVDGPRTSAGSDVLANASGAGMATGVGVQLFKGGPSSTDVLPLGTKVLQRETVQSNTPVTIVLTARYYPTADVASITPGLVSTTAVFTMTYE